jgi:hypothetical protein
MDEGVQLGLQLLNAIQVRSNDFDWRDPFLNEERNSVCDRSVEKRGHRIILGLASEVRETRKWGESVRQGGVGV